MTTLIENAKAARRKQLALETRVDSVDDELNSLINMTDFTLSTDTRRQLLGFSYRRFPAWDGDTSKQYMRGNVVVTNEIKWLCSNQGQINPNPLESGLTTPFRSTSEVDEDGTVRQWMRNEFCVTGMIRWHEGVRYRVKPRGDGCLQIVDSSTPPPNDTGSWEVANQ